MYFEDIQSIKRRVSVGFIPNAIEIVCDATIFYFCSFLSRDLAYENIVGIWKDSNLNSYFSPVLAIETPELLSALSIVPTLQNRSFSSTDELSETMELDSDREKNCCHNHSLNIVLVDTVYDATVADLWGLLYGDSPSHLVSVEDASKKPCFNDWFLTTRRSVLNLEKTTWMVGDKEEIEILSFEKVKVGDCRTIVFDMNLGLQTAGSKQIVSVKSVTPEAICLESKTTNSGTPFASSYYTHISTCIIAEANNRCRLIISYRVVFEKECYTIVKNPVNSAISKRIPEFYNDLAAQLQLHFTPPVTTLLDLDVANEACKDEAGVVGASLDTFKVTENVGQHQSSLKLNFTTWITFIISVALLLVIVSGWIRIRNLEMQLELVLYQSSTCN